ncbi:MAG: enoyl-CoA hydratase/isomerase family protein, partial [Alphaproteobacteria bacterium]
VDVERRGRVAVLTLRRPERQNRIDAAMALEATRFLEAARGDPGIGACVVTGHGDVFCLGGDYQSSGPTTAGRIAYADAFTALHGAMAGLGKPLVVAVNGDAHAGGFSVVVACDLAVCATDATLGLPEAAAGFFPYLALAAVRDALPKKLLFDLVYGARLLGADEAREHHLVNVVVPRAEVLDRAVALAEAAAGHDPAILMLGRDLWHAMSGLEPKAAFEQARFAFLAAMAARDATGTR